MVLMFLVWDMLEADARDGCLPTIDYRTAGICTSD